MSQAGSLSLRANFSWTLAGNVIYAACQWGILVVLAKFTNPETVGQFALGLAITSPVIMLTNLQLRGVLATDSKVEYQFGDYFALRLGMSCLAFVAIAALILIGGYRLQTGVVILLIGLAKIVESISDVLYGFFQQQEQLNRIAKSMIIKGVLSLAALTICVYLTRNIVWAAATLLITWSVGMFVYDIPKAMTLLRQVRRSQVRLLSEWHWSHLTKLAWVTLPLGLVMMLNSLTTNMPRYYLEHSWGEKELGLFAAMAYLIVAGTTVVGALGQSASPRLAKYYASRQYPEFRWLLLRLIGIAIVLGLGGILIAGFAGEQILTLIYRSEYAENGTAFILLMISAGVGYCAGFLGYAMTAARFFRAQLPLFVVITLCTLPLCIWLIPSFGIVGAAMVLALENILQLIGSGVIVAYALTRN
jgi:O-antigen/teichoic acid export membrane protein